MRSGSSTFRSGPRPKSSPWSHLRYSHSHVRTRKTGSRHIQTHPSRLRRYVRNDASVSSEPRLILFLLCFYLLCLVVSFYLVPCGPFVPHLLLHSKRRSLASRIIAETGAVVCFLSTPVLRQGEPLRQILPCTVSKSNNTRPSTSSARPCTHSHCHFTLSVLCLSP